MTSLTVTWLHVTSFLVRAASGYVTSSNACTMARSPLLPPKYALSCPDILLWYLDLGGTLWVNHKKVSKDGKVFSHLGFKSKVLPRPLTDLSTWVDFCTSSPQQGVKYQLWYLDLEGPYAYLMNNSRRTAKFFATWGLSQRYSRAFKCLNCLGGIMHLKPTAGCQISTLIFGFGGGGVGTLCISHDKLLKDGKVLCHLGIRSKVLPWPLTDLSA